MSRPHKLAALLTALLTLNAYAKDELFTHQDWELVCDNTRTCRAAGYQSDNGQRPVSVLLTRKGGPGQAVTGELIIGDYDSEELKNLPPILKLTMRINQQNLGTVTTSKDNYHATLTTAQTSALIAALSRKSNIRWSAGKYTWTLSDQGAAAVLLKMDEFQGRIGTPGAIIKKGKQAEETVPPALPAMLVTAAPLAKSLPGDAALAGNKALREALRSAVGKDDYCPDLTENATEEREISITRLNGTQLLASTQCWSGAYNVGFGYWIIDAKAPFHPVLVTESGSELIGNQIHAAQKGRGLGDCWSINEWTWDGKQFVQTEATTTGMCKLIAAGGAWSLPRIVSNVR